jgi:hypothetical protein
MVPREVRWLLETCLEKEEEESRSIKDLKSAPGSGLGAQL